MRRISWLPVLVIVLAGGSAALAKDRVVKLKMGPFAVEPNLDREVCQVLTIPNVPAGTQLVEWEARSKVSRKGAVGSHHLVSYAYTGSDLGSFPKGIVDSLGCVDIGPSDFFTKRVFLAGSGGESQVGNWTVTKASMPGNLAQVLPTTGSGDAVVVLNSHYFNTSSKRGKGFIKVVLRLAPLTAEKKVITNHTHLTASDTIFVPPGTNQTVASSFQADGAVNVSTEGGHNPSDDTCIFVLSTHMHQRGYRFTIDFESADVSRQLIDWPDYLHSGTVLLPNFGSADAPVPGLLRKFTKENGYPTIKYGCTFGNGVEGKPIKMGCEEEPGETPGMSQIEANAIGRPFGASKECGKDASNCGGSPCVEANIGFGPRSDDEMCVLTLLTFAPTPGADPATACSIY